MTLQLNGTWENSYGSILKIQASDNGKIVGEYSSTTGSSGTYYIVGYCRPENPTRDIGQGVVLSIYWRAIENQDPDNSWHWVSTYCGQLQANGELSVINSLVATIDFAGYSTGAYIDKLLFTQQDNTVPVIAMHLLDRLVNKNLPPINGTWNDAISGAQLSLIVLDMKTGKISGTLHYQGEDISMAGFTDTYASVDQLALQSLSVSGFITSTQTPISLSGYLLIQEDTLQLTCWQANSTSPGSSYFQTNATQWQLNRI